MKNRSHVINLLFMLSLFCVFAVTALLVVILGADVYKEISANMDANHNARVSVAYITQKVRQSGPDSVEIRDLGGSDALVLTQGIEGITYETWIYAQDGSLLEATAQAGDELFGQSITQLESLNIELSEGLLTLSVTDVYGNTHDSALNIKSTGGSL